MPLILPEQPPEHPEVTALKQKVREVAADYKRRYNWCNEINAALREAGIDTTSAKMAVTIRFSLAGSDEQTATKTFDVAALIGKTHEEQVAWVADQIAPKVAVAGVEVTLPVTVHDIDGEYSPVPVMDNGLIVIQGLSYPNGYIHFFTSTEGRVAHLARYEWDWSTLDVQTALTRFREGRRYGGLTRAICGAETYTPVAQSARSESRLCHRCYERTS